MLPKADIERVLAPLESARPFPGRAYVDEEIFGFEEEHIFARSWLCAGREDEVALPGQWLRTRIARENVVVVRGPDLALRAFLDVCRHRGAALVSADCGRTARITCPYHGWTYELDGRLVKAPFAPNGFDPKQHPLHAVKVATWAGFVFVTLDGEAPPLEEAMGAIPPWLDPVRLATLQRKSRVTYEVFANWKLSIENFQESHHFPLVHRALEELTPTSDARTWLGGGLWLGGTMEIAGGAETVSLSGKRNGRPLIVDREERIVHDAMLFPTLLTSLQPDYLLTYRLVPLAVDRTRVIADVHFHPEAQEIADVVDFWATVNAEDKAICESQQKNARSRGFRPACYATVEEGMQAFDRIVARAYERGAR